MNAIIKLYDRIYKHYRLINSVITLGFDSYWRKATISYIKKLNKNPRRICDICCGTGDLTELLSKNFSCEIIGVDANKNMLDIAKERNIKARFILANISNLPFADESFDIITISFATRNLFFSREFNKSMNEIKRVLKKGGFFISLETTMPENMFFKFFFKIYLSFSISVIKFLLPSSKDSYSFLKNSIKDFKVEEFSQKISDEFKEIIIKRLFPKVVAILIAKK